MAHSDPRASLPGLGHLSVGSLDSEDIWQCSKWRIPTVYGLSPGDALNGLWAGQERGQSRRGPSLTASRWRIFTLGKDEMDFWRHAICAGW